jgi:hypothetical protein
MSYPLLETLSDPFLGQTLNPAWTMASGTYGYDTDTESTFLRSAPVPSYLGASLYSAADSFFSVKVVPAGGEFQQTAVVIQANNNNYVQMGVGPTGLFRGFVAVNKEVFLTNENFPPYDPVAHAFWRIRDEEGKTFFFDVSADGASWTEIGSVGYAWDSHSVSVMLFAGATQEETDGPFNALFSNVNQRPAQLVLSAIGEGLSGGDGYPADTNPLVIGAVGSGSSGGTVSLQIEIIRGGITDFGVWDSTQADAANSRVLGSSSPNINSTTTGRPWISATAPGIYRDGSYWPRAAYAGIGAVWNTIPDANPQYVTNVQFEENNNYGNRLSLDAASYQNICCYAPQTSTGQGGTSAVARTSERPYSGLYGGGMVFYGATTSPRTIPSGLQVYFPYPTEKAFCKVTPGETIKASVLVSLDRPGAQWFVAIVQYNDAGTIVAATYNNGTITNMNTHPGDGIWQQGTHSVLVAGGATKAAVMPVIVVSGAPETEIAYMDNHFITGVTPGVSNAPTPYANPRELRVKVKADEINYAMNSGFNASITGWGSFASGLSGSFNDVYTSNWDSGVGYKSLGSARVDVYDYSSTSTTLSPTSKIGLGSQRVWQGNALPQIPGLKPGHTYTFSVWVRKGPNCPDIGMSFYDANGQGMFGSTSVDNGMMYSQATNGTRPEHVDGDWVRLSQTYTLPSNALPEYHIWVWIYGADVLGSPPPFSYWVDSVMVTETDHVVDHFNGDYGSADYLWEGTRNSSRTHFYQDLTHKRSRVDQIMSDNVPVGSNYTVLYAQPPS